MKLEIFRISANLGPTVYSTSMYAWEVKVSFQDKILEIEFVSQLNWRSRTYIKTSFFNTFESYVNWNFSEVAILAPKTCFWFLYACEITSSFEDEICAIGYSPNLNLNWSAYNRTFLKIILNYMWNRKFSEVASLMPKICSTK